MTDDEIIITLAKSKATANRLAKKATAAQLEQAIANLQGALDAAKKRDEAKDAKKRAANLKKLTAMMADMGLSADDIAKMAGGKPGRKKATAKRKAGAKKGAPKGTKVAPKYQIVANGETIQWTGRGRMPVPFRDFVEKGGSLEQCLI